MSENLTLLLRNKTSFEFNDDCQRSAESMLHRLTVACSCRWWTNCWFTVLIQTSHSLTDLVMLCVWPHCQYVSLTDLRLHALLLYVYCHHLLCCYQPLTLDGYFIGPLYLPEGAMITTTLVFFSDMSNNVGLNVLIVF